MEEALTKRCIFLESFDCFPVVPGKNVAVARLLLSPRDSGCGGGGGLDKVAFSMPLDDVGGCNEGLVIVFGPPPYDESVSGRFEVVPEFVVPAATIGCCSKPQLTSDGADMAIDRSSSRSASSSRYTLSAFSKSLGPCPATPIPPELLGLQISEVVVADALAFD